MGASCISFKASAINITHNRRKEREKVRLLPTSHCFYSTNKEIKSGKKKENEMCFDTCSVYKDRERLTISSVCRTLRRCTVVPDEGSTSSLGGEARMAGGLLGFTSSRLASDTAEQTFRYACAGGGRPSSKKSGTETRSVFTDRKAKGRLLN